MGKCGSKQSDCKSTEATKASTPAPSACAPASSCGCGSKKASDKPVAKKA